ncbi:hypothetical protein JYU34_000819 [Plutella xylostella]|uniref:Uncharacterized protein n=1 Tax=Plutella xylostella TaxID=51655 RepID=A0ABQ7R8M0_PLUXY|nr:hypothetical protein JYU34_000819 [Plutella xylostella]
MSLFQRSLNNPPSRRVAARNRRKPAPAVHRVLDECDTGIVFKSRLPSPSRAYAQFGRSLPIKSGSAVCTYEDRAANKTAGARGSAPAAVVYLPTLIHARLAAD